MKLKDKSNFGLIILILCVLIILLLIIGSYSLKKQTSTTPVIGNKEILNDLNRLLIPLENKNLSTKDFNELKDLTQKDQYASGEINELILLTKYQEYAHVGHGIGFIFEYVQTGNQSICPGHYLSHYYVFNKHNETEVAKDNLNDTKINLPFWESLWGAKNETDQKAQNYSFYKELIERKLVQIKTGNSTASEEEIFMLSEAPCVIK